MHVLHYQRLHNIIVISWLNYQNNQGKIKILLKYVIKLLILWKNVIDFLGIIQVDNIKLILLVQLFNKYNDLELMHFYQYFKKLVKK
jgi:hypothetical protein